MSGARETSRIDAINNDRAIIAAARELASTSGLELRAHAVAERAGISVATVKRRFPTRDDLIEGVFEDVWQDLKVRGTQWLLSTEPRAALTDFLRFCVDTERSRRGFLDVLSYLNTRSESWRDYFRALGRDLLERAQSAGGIRADIEWTDLAFLVAALAATPSWVVGLHGDDEEWTRLLQLWIDGLDAPSATPLPGTAPIDALIEEDV